MTTKHINEHTWRKVEKETVRAVVTTKEALKDTQVLDMLIKKGLETITEEDYLKWLSEKRNKNEKKE